MNSISSSETLVKKQNRFSMDCLKEKKLILVDDDKIALMILEKMFTAINPDLKILSFLKGKDALAHLEQVGYENCPYLLVDFHLLDMKGWDFLDELEMKSQLDSKVFLITSSLSSEIPERSKDYKSVAGFFEKPLTFDTLESINQLIIK
jgi:response regulator RpfG family c-di-GMP phosphodiesterase